VIAIALGLLTAALFGGASYLGPVLSRTNSPSAVLAAGQVAAVAAAVGLVAVAGGPLPAGGDLALGAVAGVANGLALTAMFESARFLPISVMAPIGATGGIVPVAVALALGERPTTEELIGIPLALAGVILVAAGQGRRRTAAVTAGGDGLGAGEGVGAGTDPAAAAQADSRGTAPGTATTPAVRPRTTGYVLAAIWAVLYGVFLSTFAEASKGGHIWAVLTSRVTLLLTVVVVPLMRRAPLRLPRAVVPLAVLNGLLILAGVTSYALATQAGLISVVSVLATLSPLVTVGLAVVVLHERLTVGQRIGLCAATAGVVLMALG
jgi:drug/metabolite transporter (DMT)-like permease